MRDACSDDCVIPPPPPPTYLLTPGPSGVIAGRDFCAGPFCKSRSAGRGIVDFRSGFGGGGLSASSALGKVGDYKKCENEREIKLY